MLRVIEELAGDWRRLDQRVDGLSGEIEALARQDQANDKVVFGTAKWSATGKDKEGKPSPFSGLATHVFERQADGSLKLRLQTFN